MFLGLVLGDERRLLGRGNGMYLFGGIYLGDSNVEKWGDHWEKNLFINSFVGISMCDSPNC